MPSEITLREVIPSDLSMFFEQQTDPEAVAMVSFTEEGSLDREGFIARWMEIFWPADGYRPRHPLRRHGGRRPGEQRSYTSARGEEIDEVIMRWDALVAN